MESNEQGANVELARELGFDGNRVFDHVATIPSATRTYLSEI